MFRLIGDIFDGIGLAADVAMGTVDAEYLAELKQAKKSAPGLRHYELWDNKASKLSGGELDDGLDRYRARTPQQKKTQDNTGDNKGWL
jgi:hypothetical protein